VAAGVVATPPETGYHGGASSESGFGFEGMNTDECLKSESEERAYERKERRERKKLDK
jgi:hypothetical protein